MKPLPCVHIILQSHLFIYLAGFQRRNGNSTIKLHHGEQISGAEIVRQLSELRYMPIND